MRATAVRSFAGLSPDSQVREYTSTVDVVFRVLALDNKSSATDCTDNRSVATAEDFFHSDCDGGRLLLILRVRASSTGEVSFLRADPESGPNPNLVQSLTLTRTLVQSSCLLW